MQNFALKADAMSPAESMDRISPPPVLVQPEDAPVRIILTDQLKQIGAQLQQRFERYKNDRRIAELKWLRNQRQYLGVYDPEVEGTLLKDRSRAYPRLTRIKTISTLSRIMNLMFPGNDRNWDLQASPSPEMSPEDVMQAVQAYVQKLGEAGMSQGNGPQITDEDVEAAVQDLASQRAEQLKTIIDDQLQELGGDQTYDYIALNRRMLLSGIMYGLGVLVGPFVRVTTSTKWRMGEAGMPEPYQTEVYKPMFEWVPIWEFYPDMSAKTFASMDGYFRRVVMSRAQVRKLADRKDFFPNVVKKYLSDNSQGNYKPLLHEQELRVMGVKVNVNEQSPDASKYEVISWNGTIAATTLQQIGIDVPEEMLGDDVEAEIWMIDGYIIKADINPWRKLGVDVKTVHAFIFDEDDTSPIGSGLPNVIRDSQMSVSAAARMLLDNASIVCGPNVEVNTKLLLPTQDITSVQAYKVWYRDDDDSMTTQFPAVREIRFDSHITELTQIIDLFLKFADAETFVGPMNGGDTDRMPKEPMRTAAGASMLRGDAALPFKDVIRNFDQTTQSIIQSLVQFNRVFNPSKATEGDFNVIARGATSLISKEVRGMQMDTLAQTLTDEEKVEIDNRLLLKERLATRDAEHLLLPPSEAAIQRQQREQSMQAQMAQQQKLAEAQIRETLSASYKNITQGQKNTAAADAQAVSSALDMMERALGSDDEASKDGA
jgi:VIT1/CCC1 family predicted Fe2+/Mn2+ transporter